MMKKRILITDDDAEMRAEIAAILKDEGYEVRTAGDGRAALKLIEKQKFDLLLLDLKMPVMTGFEVLKKLDADKIKIKVKVIVLTGSIIGSSLPDQKDMSFEEKGRILKLADAVMNKPFDIARLVEKIKRYTSGK
jgi:CheY-like chemotaxis protein